MKLNSIELRNETLNTIKLKIKLSGIVCGNFDKPDRDIYTQISLLVAKEGFFLETKPRGGKIIQSLFFEKSVSLDCSKWVHKYESKIEKLKKTISKIDSLLKSNKKIKLHESTNIRKLFELFD